MSERRLETDASSEEGLCSSVSATDCVSQDGHASGSEDTFLSPKLAAALRDTKIIDRSEIDELDDASVHDRLTKLTSRLQEVVAAAEEADRSKNEFLANISHELRTPLNGVIGMTELVLDSELDSMQREYLETVKTSSESLLQIISDLLDFSRVESGVFALVPAKFDLREQIVATLKTLAIRAHQKSLEFVFEIDPDVPTNVIGDSRRLIQTLSNLVGNAIKFTEQGEVVVHLSVLDDSEDEVTVGFNIRDTGIGISREQESLIFQAFSQVDGSSTRKFGGTGLGLSLSSELVRMMQGTISLESRLGSGTTFTFSARLKKVPQPARKPKTIPAKYVGADVLIVDNHQVSLDLVANRLRELGMKPTVTTDGAVALDILEKGTPDGKPWPLIFIDDRMPEVHGFVIAETVKKHPELVDTVVMMVSPGERRSPQSKLLQGVNRKITEAAIRQQAGEKTRRLTSLERCLKLGFKNVLKPFDQEDLCKVLQSIDEGPDNQTCDKASEKTASDKQQTDQRVLLAEDNRINQALAVNLLRRQGYEVTLADNGQQAFEAASEESFDVVLMDIQMPEMDGREATQAIRKLADKKRADVPIIALTAHDMEGDREHCFEAGMNGYVTKPIQPKALFAEMTRLLNQTESWECVDDVDPNEDTNDVIDRAAVLGRVEGNRELLSVLVSTFDTTHTEYLEGIRTAIESGDCESVNSKAHGLKGAVATLGGIASREHAYQLEQMGRSQELSQAAATFELLEQAVEELRVALFEMLE